MKKLQLFACAIAACICAHAQTVTPSVMSSNGGFNSSGSGSVAWTIGEPVSDTYKKPQNITTMGFHQTEMEVINLIGENNNDPGRIVVFPNPVHDILKVNFSGMEPGQYSIRISDAAGRHILGAEADIDPSNPLMHLMLREMAEGNYLMSIRGKESITTIKINKVN